VLRDWRTAPVDERLRATLGFLAKLTLDPGAVGAEDAAAVLATGVSAAALTDAVHVCALFNVIDRIADALGFHVPGPDEFARVAPGFLKRGYAGV
jgi:alkylhydroperoxidase family enzyme